jgi:hypothetical protein
MRNNELFDTVTDKNFDGWQDAPTISENELFNDIETPNDGTNTTEDFFNPNPQQQQQPIYNTATVGNGGVNMGEFFDAELATEIVDTVAATLGVIAFSFAGIKATKNQLSASAKEKKALEKPVQAVLDTMSVKVTNPYEALFWAILAVYGSKGALLYANKRMTEEPKENRQESDNTGKKRRHTGKADCKCIQCTGNG